MHRWLARQLPLVVQLRGSRLNVLAPRGSAKSTLATLAFPLWLSAHGVEPYIWIVSETRRQAIAHLENLKHELMGNEELLRDYPQLVRRGPVWRAHYLILGNGVAIEAIGSLQALRGRRRLAHRPTLIICDDIQSDRHVLSPLGRQRTRDWFFGTLLPAGTPRTCVIHLATALHPESLGLELTRTAGWRWRVFRAIERWPLHMELWKQWEQIYTNTADREAPRRAREFFEKHRAQMEVGAKVLWPEAEDLYTLMAQRAEGGPAAFEREKQNHPVAGELCEWPPEYFEGEIYFHRWPAGLRLKVMALDPSQGNESRLGDYSAYVVVGVSAEGVFYVEADLARRPLPEMLADGVRLWREHRPDVLAIEANLFQSLLGEAFARAFAQSGLVPPAPLLIENHRSKRVRIRRLGPYLAAGRLKFRSGSPSTELLLEQLRQFPLADHDDGPDALELALRVAEELLRPPPDDGLGRYLSLG
jgi:predicted phage terminase large subunit-like protein